MAALIEKLKQGELARYGRVDNWQRLPSIYGYWSSRYLLPKARPIFGHTDTVDFFISGIQRCWDESRPVSILSVGSGAAALEIGIAERLLKLRGKNIRVECLEMTPERVAQAKQAAKAKGVSDFMVFHEADINTWDFGQTYSFVIANHSLHHFVELERIFDNILRSLDDEGLFLVNDMIGKNGHTRWPETLEQVRSIWNEMPRRYKFNHPFNRFDDEYDDWDYSKRSFEGIRAQDILPLMLQRFSATHFVAECGIIDPFIERKYGHNFDPTFEEDCQFIDRVSALNDTLIDNGTIKPTLMLGWFGKKKANPLCYRHWTPDFCCRYC